MAKNKMKAIDWIAILLLVVGGINWGLDLFGVSIFKYIMTWLANIVKSLVFASAIYSIIRLMSKKIYIKR